MKKMMKSALAVSVMAASVLGSSAAMAGFSGNVGVTTDYLWRGETQTADDSAVSGGLDYEHDSGFYVGTWGSSLGGNSNYELDIYAGFAKDFGPVGLDVGYLTYQYPMDGNDADLNEVYLGVTYSVISAKYSVTNDYFGSEDSASYLEVAADIPVKDDISIGLHYGLKSGDYFDNNTDGSYADYNISLNKGDFSFMVANMDNDKIGQTDNVRVAISWSHSIDF